MKKKENRIERSEIEGIVRNESRFIVSRNIKMLRRKRGLTQLELAKKVNKTVEMICQIENNVAGTKLATLDAIADVLGVETYMLFLNRDRPNLENISTDLLELLFDLEDESPEFITALRGFLSFCINKNIDK
ncbi:MAG: helix-turn-helix transcriptional regulator [Alphaproteobacteria bacterium]|nr:helix-turn-helix transcriptional regulator [Alphaproteobacteria bacterium]